MGKSQRVKGATWERAVANAYRDAVFGGERDGAERQGGWQATSADAGGDVMTLPAGGLPALWNECKHGKAVRPMAALLQAEAALGAWTGRKGATGVVPVAVCKSDRKPPFVVVRFDDWLRLCAAAARSDK